jgi:hypothetical protein
MLSSLNRETIMVILTDNEKVQSEFELVEVKLECEEPTEEQQPIIIIKKTVMNLVKKDVIMSKDNLPKPLNQQETQGVVEAIVVLKNQTVSTETMIELLCDASKLC